MLGSLDFVYVPTHDVDATSERYVEELGAELDAVRRVLAARTSAPAPGNKLPVLHRSAAQSVVVWRRPG